MIDLNKKMWREKVTAEITVAHMQQFAQELGANLSTAEVAAFLNEKGRAQAIWTQMMQAGEQYIKSNLGRSRVGLQSVKRSGQQFPMLH